ILLNGAEMTAPSTRPDPPEGLPDVLPTRPGYPYPHFWGGMCWPPGVRAFPHSRVDHGGADGTTGAGGTFPAPGVTAPAVSVAPAAPAGSPGLTTFMTSVTSATFTWGRRASSFLGPMPLTCRRSSMLWKRPRAARWAT